MNKKAFTVVELIVSFAMAISIATLLFQIVLGLKDMYTSSITKTELLNKQSLLSKEINEKFSEKEIDSVTKCGSYCLEFIYTDNTSDQLVVDYNQKTISFSSYKTKLSENSSFGDVLIDVIYAPSFKEYFTDAILNINIPIYNDLFKEQNFGINVVYQFDKETKNISNIDFSS